MMMRADGSGMKSIVIDELAECVKNVSEKEFEELADEIRPDRRIVCDGAGRSRLQIQGFAMRLAQMGFQSSVVGDVTATALKTGDLLFVCSASGETPALVEHAGKAKDIGAEVVLITASENSALSVYADKKVVVRSSSKRAATAFSVQPMGSLFEQSIGILCDSMVLYLMKKYNISSDDMCDRHANLE